MAEVSEQRVQPLREHLSILRKSYDGASATVEDVLREVRSLERRQHSQSRFRRMARYLEPLIDFLMMYSPALDIIVQFDANPSAIIWGSIKALLKASVYSYIAFCARAYDLEIGSLECRTILQVR